MFSGFIFDVEGTLVDSVTQNLCSLQEALHGFGYDVPYGTLQLYSGLDGDQLLQLVVSEADEKERRAILKAKGTIYETKYLFGVRPFDDVRDVFTSLIKHGGRIAFATDCNGPPLDHFFLYWTCMTSSAQLRAVTMWSMANRTRALSAWRSEKLALPASQTVVVGDAPYDAEAGLEAGTLAVGVLTGGFTREALTDAGCFAVAENLRGLLPSLDPARHQGEQTRTEID